jgi:hypothetical protein
LSFRNDKRERRTMSDEQQTESTTPEAAANAKRKTMYVVLSQDESGMWLEVHQDIAMTPKGAITAYLSTLDDAEKPGTYVGVPVRSWNPLPVGVETQAKLTFG